MLTRSPSTKQSVIQSSYIPSHLHLWFAVLHTAAAAAPVAVFLEPQNQLLVHRVTFMWHAC